MNIQKLMRNERIIPLDLLCRIESSSVPLEDIKINALHLSTRSYNALKRMGVDDIRKLASLTDLDLAEIPNIGARSLQEIIRNTKEYLARIAKPEEAERLLTVSLLELIKASGANIYRTTPASLVNQNLDKQFLKPITLRDIVTNDGLLDQLVRLGLSLSLDIWVLAFGHYLKIDRVFGQTLKNISENLPGSWNVDRMMDFHINMEATCAAHCAEAAPSVPSTAPDIQYSFDFLRVELVIKSSRTSEVHWEALLPYQCLNQRIVWFRDDDKTTGLCTFLRQIANNSVVHWSDPPVENWERLPRSRPVDAFYHWLSLVERTFSGRDYEIIKRRFGLVSGERSTLQEIGSEYNITRERVRQIVNRCLKSLLHPARRKFLTPFISHLDVLFKKHGGIMTLNEIVNSSVFFAEFVGVSWLQVAELLLVGCKKYNALDHDPIKDDLNNMALRWVTWHVNEIDPVVIKNARETAKHLVGTYPLRYNSDETVDVVSSIINIDKEVVRASLRTCRGL